MTDKEVMQQAFAALIMHPTDTGYSLLRWDAIAALRTAIAQPEHPAAPQPTKDATP